jgi:hypothetical protein
MSVEESLLCGIHDQPDDELPRLAYADWLERRMYAPSMLGSMSALLSLVLATVKASR